MYDPMEGMETCLEVVVLLLRIEKRCNVFSGWMRYSLRSQLPLSYPKVLGIGGIILW